LHVIVMAVGKCERGCIGKRAYLPGAPRLLLRRQKGARSVAARLRRGSVGGGEVLPGVEKFGFVLPKSEFGC
jgi:hypothetical protein